MYHEIFAANNRLSYLTIERAQGTCALKMQDEGRNSCRKRACLIVRDQHRWGQYKSTYRLLQAMLTEQHLHKQHLPCMLDSIPAFRASDVVASIWCHSCTQYLGTCTSLLSAKDFLCQNFTPNFKSASSLTSCTPVLRCTMPSFLILAFGQEALCTRVPRDPHLEEQVSKQLS